MRAALLVLCSLFVANAVHAQEGTWGPLADALACAAEERRPALIYVNADWCVPCRRMERDVFPAVSPLLQRFARAGLVFDDVESAVEWEGAEWSPAVLAEELGASATPTFVFLDPDGSQVLRAVGFQDAERFALLLAYVATGAHRHADFDSYEEATPPNLDNVSEPALDAACNVFPEKHED